MTRRVDWTMRQLVEDVAPLLTVGMPASQAQQIMTERGVPLGRVELGVMPFND